MEENTVNKNYFYEIAFEYLSRVKRGYFLSPLEIDLIKKWEDNNVPLTIIKRSMDKGFKKPGRKKTLLYFKKIVEEEMKNRNNKLLSKTKNDNFDKSEILKEKIALIDFDYFREKYQEFMNKETDDDKKEKFDEYIDNEIIKKFYNTNEGEIKAEWNKNFQYIKVSDKEKQRLIKKYFIIKKRQQLNLFYFSYL